ncbi:MAG TPA: transcription termination factor NusA [Methylomirabilota bacterium]|jgi:transcription termination/antitermination protein NusA|nr:transcription termination factor NusA [Methylomirabilota bacterium]
MNRELIMVIEQLGREKGIDKEILFEALESALLSASRKSLPGDNMRIHIDRKTGEMRAYARRRVVAEVTDPKLEIGLDEAKALNPEAELDDELELEQERPPQDFGRIAAQTAKQVILQKVRDAEREGIYSEFAGKEGQILRGVVHRIEKRNVILEIGKAEAILPEREQIPGERYNPGDRIRAFVLEVRRSTKGPQITLSRTHPGYLARLFETEIPEIQEGIVVVKATAREAGERAKVAVASTKRDVDPIGACVGLRGTRIQVISRELRGEKIDIIEWSHDPATFVARALSPAKVSSVTVSGEEGADASPAALVIVPDNQLSLAIGKKGQNARLAAKLTGMRIDIKSESEVESERADAEEARATLSRLVGGAPEVIEALEGADLMTPRAIVDAGPAALQALPAVGDRAAKIYAAAEEWLATRAQAAANEAAAASEAAAKEAAAGAAAASTGEDGSASAGT